MYLISKITVVDGLEFETPLSVITATQFNDSKTLDKLEWQIDSDSRLVYREVLDNGTVIDIGGNYKRA